MEITDNSSFSKCKTHNKRQTGRVDLIRILTFFGQNIDLIKCAILYDNLESYLLHN